MDQDPLRKQMLESYLRQQQPAPASQRPYAASVASAASHSTRNAEPAGGGGGQLVAVEATENISLEEFREYVRKWLELDNMIKKAQEAIRERKKVRDKLSMVISSFMCKYNIEDLNTKEGRIRCKVSTVKAPVSQKAIKQKISDYFGGDEDRRNEILSKIYEEREEKEKVSLRRLKIT